MTIQEISVSNNQKKTIQKALKKSKALIEEENGDLVLDQESYFEWCDDTGKYPLEDIMPDQDFDDDAQYIVFV
ncbi:MAG: hypothetical protein CL679_10585 [Bermanella sp.]|nr:hypothetical protein [Bermanella sp.]|tara:strand:- start:2210 stop:2428 length:219 start_codon:yes stop_codon:yes gene_type:complete